MEWMSTEYVLAHFGTTVSAGRRKYRAFSGGGGDFVEGLLREAEDRDLRQLRIKGSGKTMGEIIEEECRNRSVSGKELRSGSRRRMVSEARAVIAFRAIEELGLATAEIAGALGVATSSVSRAITRGAGLRHG